MRLARNYIASKISRRVCFTKKDSFISFDTNAVAFSGCFACFLLGNLDSFLIRLRHE